MKSPVILIGESAFSEAQLFFDKFQNEKIFILVDINTKKYCLDFFLSSFPSLKKSIILELNHGESIKTISTISLLSNQLIKYGAEKKSLLINLGGGVISDLGGFLASVFNRGINFVNIPTTLLSQVDASIGGKTGVNFNHIKNKLGFFYNPGLVLIIPFFLRTLSKNEFISGFGEIFKYSLIYDKDMWNILKKTKFKLDSKLEDLISQSIIIKKNIVKKDPFDNNVRKVLNFGHTIGHAIESAYFHNSKFNHGICVVIGMICESYISNKLNRLSESVFISIYSELMCKFPLPKVENIEKVLSFIKSDKKNEKNEIKIITISKIGKANFDVSVSENYLKESLIFFNSLHD